MNDSNANRKIKNTWMAWSSGKDSAFALYVLLKEKIFSVSSLLTTITSDYERISIHATRLKLLRLQADRLNLPLELIEIPKNCSFETYEQQMSVAIQKAETQQVEHIAFGDLFLESVREYREKQFNETNIRPLFPLWNKDTKEVSKAIIHSGFKAVVQAIDKTKMPEHLLGHEYNMAFLSKLPDDVDPCGENGEFHTFVCDAPIFSGPINYTLGQTVKSGDAMYIDLHTCDLAHI